MLTSRTLEGRFYMVADRPDVNAIIVGVVARGQRRHGVLVHGLAFMSNHFHIVVTGDNPEQIAEFMKYVKSNLTGEFNRIRGRSGTMWHRRYDMELADHDVASHVGMMAYVLAHGAKEGLVERPQMWSGVTSARELLDGAAPEKGVWIRRTAMGRTTKKVVAENPERFRVNEQVELTPLPTLADMADGERQALLREAVHDRIEQDLAAMDVKPRPARSAVEAARRARRTDWRITVGSPKKKHLRVRRTAPWRRKATVELMRAVRTVYAEQSRLHRAGEASAYPPFTFPAWQRMGEDNGVAMKRLAAWIRKEWRRRPTTGVRTGPGTYCRARPPPQPG